MVIATTSHVGLFLATLLLVSATVRALPTTIPSLKEATTQSISEAVATVTAEEEAATTETPVEELTTTAVEEAANETISQEEVMHFLSQYGYLDNKNNNNSGPAASMDISGPLKLMQKYAGIPATGKPDEATMRMMRAPRCGLKDGAEDGALAKRYNLVSRWSTIYLKYKVYNYPSNSFNLQNAASVRSEIAKSFKDWSDAAELYFTSDNSNPNIKIKFLSGNHGDGYPFDGKGKVLAHAFFPPKGILHMDNDEKWSTRIGGTDLRQVMTHELGHVLGLGHSSDREAVMYAYYRYKSKFKLGADDIKAIRILYGATTRVYKTTTPKAKKSWWWWFYRFFWG